MVGAINFMRAWRNVCKRTPTCHECEYDKFCMRELNEMTDDEINKLISAIIQDEAKETERRQMPFFYEPEDEG